MTKSCNGMLGLFIATLACLGLFPDTLISEYRVCEPQNEE